MLPRSFSLIFIFLGGWGKGHLPSLFIPTWFIVSLVTSILFIAAQISFVPFLKELLKAGEGEPSSVT